MERLLSALEAIRALLTPKGTWGYRAGTGGCNLTLSGKHMLSLSVYANGADATITINGGDTITIRSGMAWGITPQPPLENAVIVISSHGDYQIETST